MSKYKINNVSLDKLYEGYSQADLRNYFRPFHSLRKNIQRNLRLANKGMNRCLDSMNDEENSVESFLKRVYLGNFSKNMNDLSLSEIISIHRGCEVLASKIKRRVINKEGYAALNNNFREFNDEGDSKFLKIIGYYAI